MLVCLTLMHVCLTLMHVRPTPVAKPLVRMLRSLGGGVALAALGGYSSVPNTCVSVSNTHVVVSNPHIGVSNTHVRVSDTHARVSNTSRQAAGAHAAQPGRRRRARRARGRLLRARREGAAGRRGRQRVRPRRPRASECLRPADLQGALTFRARGFRAREMLPHATAAPSIRLRPVVYSSPIGCTSRIVKSFRSRRSLSGRFKFTVRRHKFNKDSLSRAARRGSEAGSYLRLIDLCITQLFVLVQPDAAALRGGALVTLKHLP